MSGFGGNIVLMCCGGLGGVLFLGNMLFVLLWCRGFSVREVVVIIVNLW